MVNNALARNSSMLSGGSIKSSGHFASWDNSTFKQADAHKKHQVGSRIRVAHSRDSISSHYSTTFKELSKNNQVSGLALENLSKEQATLKLLNKT
jgi:hypothetical protein